MDNASVTNELSNLLAGRKVIAGVFTTYNFEPDFFELDVIPELLSKGIPYSTDERVKIFQVREALRESDLKLDVFYDLQVLINSAERSPEMEYLCHGVNSGNNAFHAKNIYLLVDSDEENKKQSLLVAAGSNNITRAGWWSNIEVQHWEEVRSSEVHKSFLNCLREDIAWLQEHRSSSFDNKSALDLIERFLSQCRHTNGADAVNYYSLGTKDLFKFLRTVRDNPLSQYKNWKLEIISPFFAEDTESDLHAEFLKGLGVEQITMLLPLDDEKVGMCKQGYYEHINNSENIQWGQWRPPIKKSLSIDGDLFRRIHAKIYHFYNGRQAWAFIGSVNFSYKAIYENTESGFFVRIPMIEPLLEPFSETIEKFKPPLDEEGINSDSNAESLPELHLTYDWVTKKLRGRTAKRMQYQIKLISPENESAITPWVVKYKEELYGQNTSALEDILKQGSLVKVTGQNSNTGRKFREHRVMIQQVGWTHKPIDLPQLTAEQILAIYAGMTPEQRQMTVLNALLKKLILQHIGGEITSLDDNQTESQFFCEYAEIFHAFRVFRKRLQSALNNNDFIKVDYYLTGTGMDSIPTLIERVCDEDSVTFNGVTSYLLLLSVIETLSVSAFVKRPNVHEALAKVKDMVFELKEGSAISLENDSQERRKDFFEWFEQQFSREYSSLESIENFDEVSK